jgi:hypothetical protein
MSDFMVVSFRRSGLAATLANPHRKVKGGQQLSKPELRGRQIYDLEICQNLAVLLVQMEVAILGHLYERVSCG